MRTNQTNLDSGIYKDIPVIEFIHTTVDQPVMKKQRGFNFKKKKSTKVSVKVKLDDAEVEIELKENIKVMRCVDPGLWDALKATCPPTITIVITSLKSVKVEYVFLTKWIERARVHLRSTKNLLPE